MSSKSPAFQFYPADFLIGCMGMSDEEIGIYMKMLCVQWERGSIPNDRKSIKKLINSRKIPSEMVMHKFEVCDDGNLRNKRMEKEREKQTSFRESRVNNAKKRWEKGNQDDALAPTVHKGSTSEKHALQSSSSSSSSTTTPTPSGTPPAAGVVDGDDWGEIYPTVIAERMTELQSWMNSLHPAWRKRPHFSAKELHALHDNASAWLSVEDADKRLLAAYMEASIPAAWRKDPRDFPQPDNRLGLINIGPSSILSFADNWLRRCKREGVAIDLEPIQQIA